MQSRVLIQEINEILERINRRIDDAQGEPAKTRVLSPGKKFSSCGSFESFNGLLGKRSESQSKRQSKLVARTKKTEPRPNPENYTYSPLICKNSLRIMSKCQSSRNICKDSISSLADDKKKNKKKNLTHTFKPVTNEKSAKILELAKKTRKVPWDELYKLSYLQKPKKNLVIEEVLDVKEPSEKEFTFKASKSNIFERHSWWLHEKSEKIMALAELERRKEYKECTFVPKINLKLNEVDDDDKGFQTINGVRLYLERQKAAKQEIPDQVKTEPRSVYKDLSLHQYHTAKSDLKTYLHSFTIP